MDTIDGVPSDEKLMKEIGEKTIAAIKEQNKPQKINILKILGLGVWSVFLLWLGAFFNAQFAETKQLTLPTTVYDGKGNKLHLEAPFKHTGYYEYPIILYDTKNNTRRIDKYAYAKELGKKFEGE